MVKIYRIPVVFFLNDHADYNRYGNLIGFCDNDNTIKPERIFMRCQAIAVTLGQLLRARSSEA